MRSNENRSAVSGSPNSNFEERSESPCAPTLQQGGRFGS